MVKQKETNIEFAVKAFSKNNIEASSTGRACLVNEITIMRKIDSPYLVGLKYVYETHNSLYLVLELLSGGEIFKIDDGQLNTQHAKFILYNLLKGIRDLRKANIIHRDLKPDNIIFKYKDRNVMDNELKIVDFGLSSFTQQTTFLVHRKCGTPGFIAPEVIHM